MARPTSRRSPGGVWARSALIADAARSVEPRQAVGRIRRLIPPAWLLAAAPREPAPAFAPHAAGLLAELASQSAPGPAAGAAGAFTAVGVTRPFAPSRAFWTDDADGLLFLFGLHGFAELPRAFGVARGSAAPPFWAGVATSWLDLFERPELPAWHPYPTSVRVISWSAGLSAAAWPAGLRARMVESLWRQALYLRRAVEHDIGGNHVLKNAAALVCAGACFDDERLVRSGLLLLERELPRQFLADGGHIERSPAYHREALHDLGQVGVLLRRSSRAVPAVLERTVEGAAGWLDAVAGPDGRLPLLNDAWEGPPVAGRPAEAVTVLADSGHVVLRHRGDQVLLDCGPLGPRHLPAHAHADALSFVAWFDREPFAVDRGTFAYAGPERERFRATAAHNTVEVAGRDQCEFWGDFRAGHLPTVELGELWRAGDVLFANAGHDGYRRCPGAPVHQRVLVWLPGDGLVVIDRLVSSCDQSVRSFVHLAPAAGADIVIESLGSLSTARVSERHAPWLGTAVAASAVVAEGVVGPRVTFGWSLLRAGAAVVGLDADAVTIRRGTGAVAEYELRWPTTIAGRPLG